MNIIQEVYEKKMYTINQFVHFRKSLDVLRNELKLCMRHKTMSFRFAQEAQNLLDIIELEHEFCNRSIGELTE